MSAAVQLPELKSMVREEGIPGFRAVIEIGPSRYNVSRLDGEDGWTVDGRTIIANGFPVHQNGYGARYLLTSELTDVDALRVLNEARYGLALGETRG